MANTDIQAITMNRRNFFKTILFCILANRTNKIWAGRTPIHPYKSQYIDKFFKELHDYPLEHLQDPVSMINSLFASNNIVCVGERHMEEYREFVHKNLHRINCQSFGIEIEDYYNNKLGCIDSGRFMNEYQRADKSSKMRLVDTGMNCGKIVRCLDSNNTDREQSITENIKKYANEKMLVWYGAQHVSKYDDSLNRIPTFRRLLIDGIKASSILMITPSDNRVISNAFFYSPLKWKNFGLENLVDIPEEKYNFNINIKSSFISYDASIYYVDKSFRTLQ